MHKSGMISIWFFIGALLLVYGALILGAGVYQYLSPPERPTVLAALHAGIWWGLVLLALGAVYAWKFAPRRGK